MALGQRSEGLGRGGKRAAGRGRKRERVGPVVGVLGCYGFEFEFCFGFSFYFSFSI